MLANFYNFYLIIFVVIFYFKGPLAQWLEQRTHNPLVVGSNPTGPINQKIFL